MLSKFNLKGHTNETIFSIFLYISVWHRSLTVLMKFFEIRIRIDGDICNRKLTLRIVHTESRRLCISLIRRVADSAYQPYGESPTLRVIDTES